MRVVAGSARGVVLKTPDGMKTRPTSDKVKEAMFSIIQFDLPGAQVLDLFAGTGGIGLEFVSRGAREVTAVEMAHTQQNFIISCCKQLGVKNLHLIRGDVFKFVKACHVQYDFIYADPPYDLELLPTLPDLIFEQGILKDGGYFVFASQFSQSAQYLVFGGKFSAPYAGRFCKKHIRIAVCFRNKFLYCGGR